jgi:ribosome-binding factor A
MSEHRKHRLDGMRPVRLEREMLDACRTFILPSIADPIVSGLEVCRVVLAGDLCNVTFVLMPGPGDPPPPPEQVKTALERVAGYARRLLAESVPMKRTPAVRLEYLPIRIRAADEE